jgi:hypothetical protein
MEDVNISKFRAQVVRAGSTPASPGFVVSEGQNPVDPSGSGQNHLPVTIATASTGLSITESQVLGGAGTVGQYIRGDGSLADFPATTGGGSSVSYYLNSSVSQGTIGGVAYREVNRTPIFGAGTDITTSSNGYIANFLTDAGDPNKLLIPAGNWNLETYFSANSGGGSPTFYVELYKYNGTTFTLIATSSATPELIAFGTNINPYFSTLAVPETVLALTDRLALRYYVNTSGRTITLHTENNHLCQVITTFTSGLTALNGLTSQVQYLTVGTSGTDFAISSATDTHTFNLPTASATNRGALSSADWTTFNNKTSNLGTVTSVGLSSATSGVTIGSTPITTSGTITLAIATASGSQNGLLSSTDWTTFNGKQNALTNPVTGTGANGQVAYFTGTSAISSESNLVWDATNNRLGINTTPAYSLDVNGTGQFGNTSNNTNAIQFLDANSSKTHIGSAFGATFIQNNNFYNGSAYVFDDNTIGSANVTLSAGTINFQTGLANVNPSTKLTMFSDGNVFIGTSPSNAGFKLDVNGTGRFSAVNSITVTAGSNIINSTYSGVNGNWLTIQNAGGVLYAGLEDSTSTTFGATAYAGVLYLTGARNFEIFTSSLKRLTIASTGAATFSSSVTANGLLDLNSNSAITSVNDKFAFGVNGTSYAWIQSFGGRALILQGVGNEVIVGGTADNGAYNLQCNGTGVWGAGAYVNGSDRNIKDNISTIEKGLEYIEKMNPVRFKYKPNYTRDHTMQTGFIAQELQEVFANEDYLSGLVQNGVHLSVAYQNLLPILVKAIQEQQVIINDLKQKIS